MTELILRRRTSGSMGTLGIITCDGKDICQTLELPWNNNSQNSSCIPDGKYKLRKINSPKFGEVYEICDVRDREHILIHKGNFLRDTHGCVLVGMINSLENCQYRLYNSKIALEAFIKFLEGKDDITLEIK